MRTESEGSLKDAFPAVTVTTTGAKSISLEGGSLNRKVDVVPSHSRHDTASYQVSQHQKDRGIYILDKHAGTRSYNLPFMHMHQIHSKDGPTLGGTKKVVRLLKNLKSDFDYSEHIKLSSYDIAGIVWHFDDAGLAVPRSAELRLLNTAKNSAYGDGRRRAGDHAAADT